MRIRWKSPRWGVEWDLVSPKGSWIVFWVSVLECLRILRDSLWHRDAHPLENLKKWIPKLSSWRISRKKKCLLPTFELKYWQLLTHMKSHCGGWNHEAPSLAEEILTLAWLQGEEDSVVFRGVAPGSSATLQGKLTTQENIYSTGCIWWLWKRSTRGYEVGGTGGVHPGGDREEV